jgi:ABC-type dipeptide/oligopeptide/nickel transport system permease component
MGNPVYSIVGIQGTDKQYDEAAKFLGLDKPFYLQYTIFIRNIVKGNLGISYTARRPVLELMSERFPATFELVITATCISIVMGIFFGIFTAVSKQSLITKLTLVFSLAGISAPTFLIGAIFILVFSVELGILPAMGRGDVISLGWWSSGFFTLSGIKHLVLPAVTLSIFQLAMILRLIRADMSEELVQDYVLTAWSKGLRPYKIYFKHAFRNAFNSAMTMIAMQFVLCLAFSVVVESIFQWPGLGRLLLTALSENDHPVIVVYILFVAAAIVIANLIVDIGYALLDPRLRYE